MNEHDLAAWDEYRDKHNLPREFEYYGEFHRTKEIFLAGIREARGKNALINKEYRILPRKLGHRDKVEFFTNRAHFRTRARQVTSDKMKFEERDTGKWRETPLD